MQKSQDNSQLPPWLLKMSATTAKPKLLSRQSSTTTESAAGPVSFASVAVPIESQSSYEAYKVLVDYDQQHLIDVAAYNEDDLDTEDIENEDLIDDNESIFINLPIQQLEMESVQTDTDNTILIAIL